MDKSLRSVPDGPEPSINFRLLVEDIKKGNQHAIERFYAVMNRGMRCLIARQLSNQLAEDTLHNSFLIIVSAIQAGHLHKPENLMGFVRTVVRRQITHAISELVARRKDEDINAYGCSVRSRGNTPEEELQWQERITLMNQVLLELSARDREVLTRFYLNEQSLQDICQEMDLSETQFRLLKSRAKSRFADLGEKKLKWNTICRKVPFSIVKQTAA